MLGVQCHVIVGQLGGLLMPRRFVEVSRLVQHAAPFLGVAVSRYRLLAAAQFLARLALLGFFPLIHLDVAAQTDGIGRDTEILIDERFVRRRIGRKMNQLAVVGCIDRIGYDVDDEPLALLQRLVGFDRAAFVPEKQRDADDDENDADDDAGEGFADAAEPGGTRSNLDGVGDKMG